MDSVHIRVTLCIIIIIIIIIIIMHFISGSMAHKNTASEKTDTS